MKFPEQKIFLLNLFLTNIIEAISFVCHYRKGLAPSEAKEYF